MNQYKINILFLVVALLLGCTAAVQKTQDESVVKQVWPPAPERARIEFVKEYKVLEDTASRQGFWGKISDFFLGPKTANLTRPYGVCTDQKGKLFIADTGGAKIHVFDMVKEKYSAIRGTDDVPLESPISVQHVDGRLYITDSISGQILQYDLSKKILKRWSLSRFKRPTGLAYDVISGWFYVADSATHEIIVLNHSGIEQFRFGKRGSGIGQFNFPTDLWLDSERQLYVTDALNARLQVFSSSGKFLREFGQPGDTPGSFAKPKGIAVDHHGHVFVCDALFDAVQIFDPFGQLLMTFGDNGTRPGQFWMPSGIFVDNNNHIYVSDTYNRRIQVFKEVVE